MAGFGVCIQADVDAIEGARRHPPRAQALLAGALQFTPPRAVLAQIAAAGFADDFAAATVHDPRITVLDVAAQLVRAEHQRSEDRRVGKECDSTCKSVWPPYH